MSLDFIARLQDGISGPAKDAQKSLEALGGAGGGAGTILAGAGVAIAGAFAAAAVAITAFALAAASGRVAFESQLEALLGTESAAKDVAGAIDEIAKKVPMAADRLESLAVGLAAAGLQGKVLTDTLETLAIVGSAAGDKAASKLEKLVQKMGAAGKFDLNAKALAGTGLTIQGVLEQLAASSGKSLAEVTAAMKAGTISVEQGMAAINAAAKKRFGAALEKQTLSLGTQFLKLKEAFVNLFEDIDILPFLRGMKDVLSIFDSSTSTGKALKEVFVGTFNGILSAATAALPYVKAMLKGMVVATLQMYIVLKPIGRAIVEAFSAAGIADFNTAVTVGKVLMYGLAATIAIVVGSIAFMIGFIALPFVLLGVALIAAYDGIVWLIDAVSTIGGVIGSAFASAWEAVTAFVAGFLMAPGQIIAGLVDGIIGGIGAVVGAITQLGAAAVDALSSVLDINSPSKVFEGLGAFTSEGFAEGVTGASPQVNTAVGDMAGGAAATAAGAGAGGAGGKSPASVIINFHGQVDQETARRGTLEALAEAFGPLQLEAGI